MIGCSVRGACVSYPLMASAMKPVLNTLLLVLAITSAACSTRSSDAVGSFRSKPVSAKEMIDSLAGKEVALIGFKRRDCLAVAGDNFMAKGVLTLAFYDCPGVDWRTHYRNLRQILGVAEESMTVPSNPELPIKTLRFTVAEQSHAAFVDEVEGFARANGFHTRVGKPTPAERAVTIQMWREDLKVIGVNPFDPSEFRLSFYSSSEHADSALVERLAENLVDQTTSVAGVALGEKRPDDR